MSNRFDKTEVAMLSRGVHHIQRKILNKLLYTESLGYAQIRPPGIESNQFAYHLDQLVRSQIVAKQDKKYSLAPEGLALVDRLSQEKMVDRLQPHIVTAIDLTNEKGETLLFRRGFQPYFHLLGFPLGKTHFEEDVLTAANRELQEKTGLTNVALTHRGMVYIEATQAGQTISKVLYHVFQGTITGRPATTASHRGSCQWADHTTFRQNELMPGFLKVKELLDHTTEGLFFAELTQELQDLQADPPKETP